MSSRKHHKRPSTRGLSLEGLEQRQMMTVDMDLFISPAVESSDSSVPAMVAEFTPPPAAPAWHNADQPCDVDYDKRVTAQDALVVINRVLLAGSQPVIPSEASRHAYDVNADGTVDLNDAQVVLDKLFGRQNVNQSPVLEAIPDYSLVNSQAGVVVALKATDRDGDLLTFHASAIAANGGELPVEFRVDGNYLAISPKAGLSGKSVFEVTVSDGKQVATRRFAVVVTAPIPENTAPDLQQIVNQTFRRDQSQLVVQLQATDADHDAITYSVSVDGVWAAENQPRVRIDGTQLVITPPFNGWQSQQSEFQITVHANDGQSEDSASFRVTVAQESTFWSHLRDVTIGHDQAGFIVPLKTANGITFSAVVKGFEGEVAPATARVVFQYPQTVDIQPFGTLVDSKQLIAKPDFNSELNVQILPGFVGAFDIEVVATGEGRTEVKTFRVTVGLAKPKLRDDGTLEIFGTSSGDLVTVSEVSPGRIGVTMVTDFGMVEADYDAQQITKVKFYGQGGDDSFLNLTDLPVDGADPNLPDLELPNQSLPEIDFDNPELPSTDDPDDVTLPESENPDGPSGSSEENKILRVLSKLSEEVTTAHRALFEQLKNVQDYERDKLAPIIADAEEKLARAIAEFKEQAGAVRTWAAGKTEEARKYADEQVGKASAWAEEQLQSVANWLDAQSKPLRDSIKAWDTWMKDSVAAIKRWGDDATGQWEEWGGAQKEKLETWADGEITRIKNWASGAIDAIEDQFGRLPLPPWAKKEIQKIKDRRNELLDQVDERFEQALDDVRAREKSAIAGIKSQVSARVSEYESSAGRAMKGLNDQIAGLADRATTLRKEVQTSLTSQLGEIRAWLQDRVGAVADSMAEQLAQLDSALMTTSEKINADRSAAMAAVKRATADLVTKTKQSVYDKVEGLRHEAEKQVSQLGTSAIETVMDQVAADKVSGVWKNTLNSLKAGISNLSSADLERIRGLLDSPLDSSDLGRVTALREFEGWWKQVASADPGSWADDTLNFVRSFLRTQGLQRIQGTYADYVYAVVEFGNRINKVGELLGEGKLDQGVGQAFVAIGRLSADGAAIGVSQGFMGVVDLYGFLRGQLSGRSLNQAERDFAGRIFGNKLNFSEIKIVENAGEMFAGSGTWGGTILLNGSSLGSTKERETFAHELAHAYQNQNAGTVNSPSRGTGTAPREHVSGHPYELKVDESTTWHELGVEAQAEMVGQYLYFRETGDREHVTVANQRFYERILTGEGLFESYSKASWLAASEASSAHSQSVGRDGALAAVGQREIKDEQIATDVTFALLANGQFDLF